MIQNYVDTSNTSLLIGLVTLIIVFLVVKHILDRLSVDPESMNFSETQIVMYSALCAVVLSLLIMVLYKQSLIFKGNRGMLTEEFFE